MAMMPSTCMPAHISTTTVYEPSDALFSEKFAPHLSTYPVFTGDDVDELIGFIRPKVFRFSEGMRETSSEELNRRRIGLVRNSWTTSLR
jgi:hypothetical protein